MDILSFDGIDVEIRTVEKTQIPLNGDLVQCIGEMTEEPTFGILRMQARITRVMNGIDIELYEKVAELLNKTLNLE
ncbi:unnamed protein product [Rhizopus stolonifer]